MNVLESIMNRTAHPFVMRAIDSAFFVVEFLILFFILQSVFPQKGGHIPKKRFYIIFAALGGILQTAAAFFSKNNFAAYILFIFVVTLLFTAQREGGILMKTAWSLLCISLVVFAESAMMDIFINGLEILDLSAGTLFFSSAVFISLKSLSKLLLLGLACIIKKVTAHTDFAPPRRFQFFFFAMSLMTVVLIYLMFVFGMWISPDVPPFLMLGITLVLLAIILIVYNLYINLAMEYNKNLQTSLINQRLSFQEKHYSDISDVYGDMRELRHDLINHISCMDELIKKEDYRSLRKYFAQLKNDFGSYENWIESGNPIANAVINQKYREALAKGVEMNIEAAIPAELEDSIQDTDLCSVLSNLLDNAIAASRQVDVSRVELVIKPVKNYLSITVSNTTNGNILKDNPKLMTTKPETDYKHGLGINIVRTIVRKYDGMDNISVDKGNFTFNALLKIS